MCHKKLDASEFTTWSRNPALADRNNKVVICKNCCSDYVESNGNTKIALREILRLIDVPYLESYANTAFETYKKKRQGTNVVTKVNVYDGTETQEVETNNRPITIYTCYSVRLGILPKGYINYSFSDGIRVDEGQTSPNKIADSEEDKAIQSAIKYMKKTFGEEIYNDRPRLAKAVQLMIEELGLHKNDTNTRQAKFRLKNHIRVLVEAGILKKEHYASFFIEEENVEDDKSKTSKDEDDIVPEIKLDKTQLEELKHKWGESYKTQDLVRFERKYQDLVKNYEIKTASHEEFLKHACIASIRANDCMAKNDVDGAKTWMNIFKDTTSAGKLQPAQMSKADLSGGLNSFSEFWKTVEQAKGVIEILPTMYETPRDKADFVLFCMVQYVRRMKGMPDIEYKDIYNFYKEMESQFIDEDVDIDIDSFFDGDDVDG
jgi:hypothetical protein